MELMNQSLIWLADKLRISYGEGALLTLLKMVQKASAKYKLIVDGREIEQLKADEPIALRWPAWYAPTSADRQANAVTIKTLRDSGVMSQETAVSVIAPEYDIEDPQAELIKIKAEPPLPESPINP